MVTRSVARQGKQAFPPEWVAKREARIYKQCHPRQLDFVTDPANRISCLVGRGGGKTTGGMLRLILKMIRRPRMRCVFLAATRLDAEELIWDQLKDALANLDIPAKFQDVKLRCTLPNGSTLILRGCDSKDDIGKLRGRHFDEVGLDETALLSPELLDNLIDRILGPRLVGAMWMISTPGHILAGEFYNATRAGALDEDGVPIHRPFAERHKPEFANWDRWSSHAWTLLDGVAAGVPAMIVGWQKALATKARKKWSDKNPIWMREYLGLWAADNTATIYSYQSHLDDGAQWNQWSPELSKNVAGGVQFAKLPDLFTDWSYVIGMDLGHKDAFALEVLAFSPNDPERRIFHVYEFQRTKMHVREIAQLLIGEALDHDNLGGIIKHTGWPDAMVCDMAALGGTILDELKAVYGVTVAMAEKGFKYKLPAIELANGDLIDGRVKIMKGSKLEGEMQTLQWITNEFGVVQENKAQANNGADAFLYARTVVAPLFVHNGAPLPAAPPPSSTPTALPEPEMPAYRDESDDFSMLAPATFDADDWG